mmetsp:Transcript_16778/g.24846  ORF Transcript_16778/g.24846 Transcript_16778/m.24846 type:complete len:88 (-) Transcript_16778:37-300(-)
MIVGLFVAQVQATDLLHKANRMRGSMTQGCPDMQRRWASVQCTTKTRRDKKEVYSPPPSSSMEVWKAADGQRSLQTVTRCKNVDLSG